VGTAERLPVPDVTVDVVLLMTVLKFVTGKERALSPGFRSWTPRTAHGRLHLSTKEAAEWVSGVIRHRYTIMRMMC